MRLWQDQPHSPRSHVKGHWSNPSRARDCTELAFLATTLVVIQHAIRPLSRSAAFEIRERLAGEFQAPYRERMQSRINERVECSLSIAACRATPPGVDRSTP